MDSAAQYALNESRADAAPVCVLVATTELERFNFIRVVLAILGVRRVERVSRPDDVAGETERIAPDLVLLHDLPPDMDGPAVVRQLRDRASTAGVPIVGFNTGLGGPPRRQTLASVCDVLLPQPCLAADLRAALRACVARYEGEIVHPR